MSGSSSVFSSDFQSPPSLRYFTGLSKVACLKLNLFLAQFQSASRTFCTDGALSPTQIKFIIRSTLSSNYLPPLSTSYCHHQPCPQTYCSNRLVTGFPPPTLQCAYGAGGQGREGHADLTAGRMKSKFLHHGLQGSRGSPWFSLLPHLRQQHSPLLPAPHPSPLSIPQWPCSFPPEGLFHTKTARSLHPLTLSQPHLNLQSA